MYASKIFPKFPSSQKKSDWCKIKFKADKKLANLHISNIKKVTAILRF